MEQYQRLCCQFRVSSDGMLNAIALTATIAQASPQVQANAKIIILNPAIASLREWQRAPVQQRRKIIVREKDGKLVIVHTIEFQ